MTEINAAALQEQGVKLFKSKDFEDALTAFQQAQQAFDRQGDAGMVAEMRVNIGLVQHALGEHQQALDSMTESLNYFDGIGDQRRAAMVLGNMGKVYAALGDREQAHTVYRRAADIFDALGEKAMYSETMRAVGQLQMKEGKVSAAASSYEVGLEDAEKLSASERVLKGLIGVRKRLTGG